jgi:hypothetical protein
MNGVAETALVFRDVGEKVRGLTGVVLTALPYRQKRLARGFNVARGE